MSNYKVIKGSTLYTQLQALGLQIKQVKSAASALVKTFGGNDYTTTGNYLAGGIDGGVVFNVAPNSTNWKSVGEAWQKMYLPKVAYKDGVNKIKALPVIKIEALNNLIAFTPKNIIIDSVGGYAQIRAPRIAFGVDYVLLQMPSECGYVPVANVIEILASEYTTLLKKITDADALLP